MFRSLVVSVFWLAGVGSVLGGGMLIPVEPDLPPLALVSHRVNVELQDQVSITKVEQIFRNHTSRALKATYVFPVPPGASVREFAVWVDGRRVQGELHPAEKAEQMFADIVRQTKNPALLSYLGSDLLSLKVFPVPPQGDQKVEVSFTAVAASDDGLVEYVYPLRTERAAATTLEDFRLTLSLKSSRPLGGIYSPTHEVTITRPNDREAQVLFQQQASTLDRDFQLFYSHSGEDIGLTSIRHRPISAEDGHVMLLLSPRAELAQDEKMPRDIVFVLDTSGSMMAEEKMEQAKQAVRHCLGELGADDRFGLVQFATTVNLYRDQLAPASDEHIKHARGWVADQYAGGGTAIHAALEAALAMRADESERLFTVVFFTDGQPTVGETDTNRILADVVAGNSANTRIFSLGVGNDLNAVFLDQIAEQTRAVSRYVRPGEDLTAKVTGFFAKINHPVLANLTLTTAGEARLAEVYPPQLPDLFHGDQLVVLARYQGAGTSDVVLAGTVGKHKKEFHYEVDFDVQTDAAPFVEELWARRKVGYLLDQIRINGEQQELVDEVVRLSRQFGITTPYTSYLIMPDVPLQVAVGGGAAGGEATSYHYATDPAALASEELAQKRDRLATFARDAQRQSGQLAGSRGAYQDRALADADERLDGASDDRSSAERPLALEAHRQLARAKELKSTLDMAFGNYRSDRWRLNQVEKLGVDLAVCTNELKCQSQLQATAVRHVGDRRCMEIGGVWIDEAFTDETPSITVKAQSEAYFRILARQPRMKEVFLLGNHVVWIAPGGTALVIDTADGREQLSDTEIEVLFAGG